MIGRSTNIVTVHSKYTRSDAARVQYGGTKVVVVRSHGGIFLFTQALFTHFCLVQVEAIRLQLQGSGHRHFLFRFVLSPFQRKHQDKCALFIALVHLGFNAMCVDKVAPMVPERRQRELVRTMLREEQYGSKRMTYFCIKFGVTES